MVARHWKIWACILLVLATVTVYGGLGSHHFINFDDDLYIADNPTVKQGLTLHGIYWAFTTFHTGNWIPLTWLSHMVNCQLFGLHPAGHFVANLVLHIANTLLLFLFLLRTTEAPGPSFLVAALFALHPLHVESVAWVSERKDVLSTWFWLLTMWAYIWYAESPGVRRYLAMVLCLILGLLSKSMLVTLPLVLLLLDYWPLGRWPLTGAAAASPKEDRMPRAQPWAVRRRLIWEKLPLLVLVAVFSVVTIYAQRGSGSVKELVNFPFPYRLSNALTAYVSYIKMMIWPSHLAVYYPLNIDNIRWESGVGAGIILLLISLAVIWQARRRPYLLTGWLWYLGTLVPVIGLVQVGDQALADRYTYVPLIGLFIMVAYGLRDLTAGRRGAKILAPLGAGLLLAALAVCTYRQVGYWQDSQTLYEHTLRVTKNNYLVNYNLGIVLNEQGKVDEAIAHYEESIRNHPKYVRAHNNLGVVLLNQGKLNQAIAQFKEALRIQPDYVRSLYNLGLALYAQGKMQEAIAHYKEALRLDPGHAEAHYNLGLALYGQGKTEEAIAQYQEALKLKPDLAEAHYGLGLARQRQGRTAAAITQYQEALHLQPNLAMAHNNLGIALASQGQMQQALEHYRQALKLQPDYAWAMNNLAYILATATDGRWRDGPAAVQWAEKANRLTGYCEPGMLDTLAAAYAAVGRFPEAIQASRRAALLARLSGKPELAQEIDARTRLYRAGRPYRAGLEAAGKD